MTINLNYIIDYNYYPIPETRTSNLRHRPIGIGVQGLANVFLEFGYSFDSDEAKDLNEKIFECIYYGSLECSMELAKKREEKVIKYNEDGKEIDDSIFGTLNGFFILSLIGLVIATFVDFPIEGKLALFTFHTLSFGPLLGLTMIQIDENDGLKAVILTLLIKIGRAHV